MGGSKFGFQGLTVLLTLEEAECLMIFQDIVMEVYILCLSLRCTDGRTSATGNLRLLFDIPAPTSPQPRKSQDTFIFPDRESGVGLSPQYALQGPASHVISPLCDHVNII